MKRVAVVVLNWNGVKLMEEFLPSVVTNVPDYAEVIIADNASTDESIAWIKQHYPQIRIIQNKENYGFAQGYNEALKFVEHEYLVLLNSDIETPPHWIEPIIEFMDNNPKAGACMPKILQYKSKTEFEYAGAAGGMIDYLGFPFCRGRIFNELETDQQQYDSPTQVFWATGACMFIKNEVFQKIEGFDNFLFAHMEEIDLCWRIQRAGYENYCIPQSTIYHLGGGTLKKLSPKKTYLNFRNNLLILVKNIPQGKFWGTIFKRMILDGIAGMKFLLEGNGSHFIAVIQAHFNFYKALPKYLKIRKSLSNQFTSPSKALIYPKSIIWQHFVKGIKKFSDL